MVRKKALVLVSAAAGWWGRGYRDLSSGPTTPVAGKTACGVRTAMDSSPPTMERRSSSRSKGTVSMRRPRPCGARSSRRVALRSGGAVPWLNYQLCVGEGEIDEESELWWFDIRAIVNEVAVAPSK